MFLPSCDISYPFRATGDMLIMTTAESPGFTNHFLRPKLHIVDQNEPCFKMKSNNPWEQTRQVVRNCVGIFGGSLVNSTDQEDFDEEDANYLEMLEMIGSADYDEDAKTETSWNYAESESSKRASRHLSGGGLLTEALGAMCVTSGTVTNFSGGVMSTSSPDELKRIASNPFKNELRLMLDDDSVKGCVFSPTNPFFNDSSLGLNEEVRTEVNRTPSQCSTRPVSPTENSHVISPNPNAHCFIFAVPAPTLVNQSTQTSQGPLWRPHDQKYLKKTKSALHKSGWYYENVSWQDSVVLLQDSDPGTFLVRDSADPNFLYSLSVQTLRGPTSVRLHYVDGRFRLDAEEKLIPNMPSFESVIELIEFYIANSEFRQRKKSKSRRKSSSLFSKEQVWVDSLGQVFSNILITKPLRKNKNISSLQHLSRMAVCGLLKRSFRFNIPKDKSLITNPSVPISSLIDSLSIPQSMSDYLKEYPYSL